MLWKRHFRIEAHRTGMSKADQRRPAGGSEFGLEKIRQRRGHVHCACGYTQLIQHKNENPARGERGFQTDSDWDSGPGRCQHYFKP
jgi:hypothetical protein